MLGAYKLRGDSGCLRLEVVTEALTARSFRFDRRRTKEFSGVAAHCPVRVGQACPAPRPLTRGHPCWSDFQTARFHWHRCANPFVLPLDPPRCHDQHLQIKQRRRRRQHPQLRGLLIWL